jgi:hypothetical protein
MGLGEFERRRAGFGNTEFAERRAQRTRRREVVVSDHKSPPLRKRRGGRPGLDLKEKRNPRAQPGMAVPQEKSKARRFTAEDTEFG